MNIKNCVLDGGLTLKPDIWGRGRNNLTLQRELWDRAETKARQKTEESKYIEHDSVKERLFRVNPVPRWLFPIQARICWAALEIFKQLT